MKKADIITVSKSQMLLWLKENGSFHLKDVLQWHKHFVVVRVVCFALVLLSGDFQYCPVRSGRRHWDGRPTMPWRWSYSVGLHSPCLGGDLRESDLAPSRLLFRFSQRFAIMAFSCRLILRLRVTPYNQTLLDISQQSNSVTFVSVIIPITHSGPEEVQKPAIIASRTLNSSKVESKKARLLRVGFKQYPISDFFALWNVVRL